MGGLLKRHSKQAGAKPGSVVFVGDQRAADVTISIIHFTGDELHETTVERVEDCFAYREKPGISWINISGLHDVNVVEKIGAHFGIHQLSQEDIVNTGQRPKSEEGDGYILTIVKMLYLNDDKSHHISEQVSLLFGKNFVISFQEQPGDVFNSVRDRIRKTIPRVRFINADYLAYALIDAVVDNYFIVLEHFAEDIEALEEELLESPSPQQLQTIHQMKRELIMMRKRVWPLREVIGGLERSESDLIHDGTRIYLRDLYEHAIQVIDTVESFRDMVSGLLDIYLSSVSNKMNEVMKVLTIIATIFIPLGFLAGVYGMNFDTGVGSLNMPELSLPYGYIGFWGAVVLVGGGLVIFFKRKGWL